MAPIRGCAPLCLLISISSFAFLMDKNAASETAAGDPFQLED